MRVAVLLGLSSVSLLRVCCAHVADFYHLAGVCLVISRPQTDSRGVTFSPAATAIRSTDGKGVAVAEQLVVSNALTAHPVQGS